MFWGLLPLGTILKSRGSLMWRFKPSLLRESSLLTMGCQGRSGVYGETVPQSFLSVFLMYQCGYFLICLMWKSHTASFWISFRGNCSMCSYTFNASKGGRKFSSLLSHHFGSSMAFLLFYFLPERTREAEEN